MKSTGNLESMLGGFTRLALGAATAFLISASSDYAAAQPTAALRAPIPTQQQGSQEDKIQVPIISKEEVKNARATYSQELRSTDTAAARKLIEDALKSQKDPASQFMLLEMATEVAARLYDFDTAFEAIDEADKIFSGLNPPGMKIAVMEKARKGRMTPGQKGIVAGADLELAIELAELGYSKNRDFFEFANKSVKSAKSGARSSRNKNLEYKADAVTGYIKELNKPPKILQLALSADDPKTCLAFGKWDYFINGKEQEGLERLAKGSDAKLKKFAELALKGATRPGEYIAIGDAAYAAASGSKNKFEKRSLLEKTLELYQMTIDSAEGAEKTKYERDPKLKKRMTNLTNMMFVDVTTLKPVSADVASTGLQINSNDARTTLKINGKECKQYLYAHAPSTVEYAIPRGATAFTALGSKLVSNNGGSWKYSVIIDGNKVYESKPLHDYPNNKVPISVDIPYGARKIVLKVDDMDANNGDWSIWAFPKFVK